MNENQCFEYAALPRYHPHWKLFAITPLLLPLAAVHVNEAVVFHNELVVEFLISFLQSLKWRCITGNPVHWECCKRKMWSVWKPNSCKEAGWSKTSQVLIHLEVFSRTKKWDSMDESAMRESTRVYFPRGQRPPPPCSPPVFGKFDIHLLTMVKNLVGIAAGMYSRGNKSNSGLFLNPGFWNLSIILF